MDRRFVGFFGILAAAVLAACGGGGGGGAAPPAGGGAPVPTSTAKPGGNAGGGNSTLAVFTVSVPAKSGSADRRSPAFIAATTQAIRFTLLQVNGAASSATPQTFPLNASQPYCTSGSNGLTCTLNVDAPVGSDVWLADTFSDTAATQKIGSGAVALNVLANARNTASITLTGSVASALLATDVMPGYYGRELSAVPGPYASSYPMIVGQAHIFLVALDSTGSQILAPTTFNAPIQLQLDSGPFQYYYALDRTRHPQTSPTDPALIATLTVNHAAGGSNATSSGTYQVPVNAPNDTISLVVVPGQVGTSPYGNSSVRVTPYIAGSPAPGAMSFNIAPDVCPTPYYTGAPPNCSYSPPATPVPTPCPAGQYGPPYCSAATVTWNSSDTRWNYYSNTLELGVNTSAAVMNVSIDDGTGSFSGPVTYTMTSGNCYAAVAPSARIRQPLGSRKPQAAPSPFPFTNSASSGNATLTLTPTSTPGTCTLTASVTDLGTTITSSPITVSVNQVTGTVQ